MLAAEPLPGDMLGNCVLLLIHKTTRHPASTYPWMAQSVKAGLLSALVFLCTNHFKEFRLQLEHFLQAGIARTMAFYPVAVEVQREFPNALLLASSPSFRASPLAPEWDNFVVLVTARLKVLKTYQLNLSPRLRICDKVRDAMNVSLSDTDMISVL